MTTIKELLPISNNKIGEEEVNAISAKDLHAFLEVGRDFSTWIKNRIDKYDFIENQDFVRVPPKWGTKNSQGGDRRSMDYFVSLDMAKEIAMVENNDKGRQARRYFIECSNKADLILQTLSYLEYQPKTDLLYLRGSAYVTDSLIVANMLNKHHYHILRDIEAEIKELEDNPNLEAPQKSVLLSGFVKDTYLSSQNKELPRYILSEEAALQVLLKYSSEIRARFILAFKEARETLHNIVKLKEISKVLPEIGQIPLMSILLRIWIQVISR